jgi:3-hydroxybutyryl-CoA dehydrogenase
MPIQQVAIIGAGPFGRKLAYLSARSGFRTILEDILPSNLRAAQEEIAHGLSGLEFAATIEAAVRNADLVMDTVPDELESKLELFSLVDRMAPPATIIATPSRALSIGDLASCTYRADRCVAVELPEDGGAAVTLVTTPDTSPEVEKAVMEFFRGLGFEPDVRVDGWQPV